VWYGGGIGNNRNTRFYSVGHLSYTGSIFPKSKIIMKPQHTFNDLELSKNLDEFFQTQIVKEEFAKHLRRMEYIVTSLYLDTESLSYSSEINDFRYWVYELSEILDPYHNNITTI